MGARRVAVVLSVVLALPACTSSEAEPDVVPTYRPEFAESTCPPELTAGVLLEMSCGFLTVPQDRDDPQGRTIKVFVARIQPSSGDPAPDPMLDLGGDIGVGPDVGGYAPMADRIGREVIVMIPRGVGYSSPNLLCPEVEELAGPALEAPSNDGPLHRTFLDRVRRCYARLVGDGIDPSDYGIAEAAADVEDLRVALDIDEWGISTHGTMSRIALEVLRRFPDHIREVVLDSPDWPQVDPFRQSIQGTRYAIDALSRACAADDGCDRQTPDVATTLSVAIAQLQSDPAHVRLPSGVDLLVDGAMLLRLVRQQMMSTGVDVIGQVPGAIQAIADGDLSAPTRSLLASAAGGQAYCPGYLPTCLASLGLYQGAYYTILCEDIAPFANSEVPQRLARGDPAYVEAFVESPYREVCPAWPVDSSDPMVAQPVASAVPTLIVLGSLDPMSTVPYTQQSASGLPSSWTVVVPGLGHGVTGASTCAQDIRKTWLDDPTSPPNVPPCAATV